MPAKKVRDFRSLQFEPILKDARRSFLIERYDATHLGFWWHYHPEFEIDVYLEGRGIRFVGDSLENFQENDLCLLGANLPHAWTTPPARGKRARSIYIQFLPDCFGADLFARPEMKIIRQLLQRAAYGLSFHGKTQQEGMSRIIAMAELPLNSWRRMTALIDLLGLLAESENARPLCSLPAPPSPSASVHNQLGRVLEFMNASGSVIPSQQDAARHARLSPQAFSRFFRKQIGKTYIQYRNELRVGRACRLLLNSERSITEIAFEAGFHNLSNFNARFSDIKGMSPRAYRRAAT